jgi:formylglycine-generating enzyme required for sulfatase activity
MTSMPVEVGESDLFRLENIVSRTGGPSLSNIARHEKTGIELIRIPAGPFLYGDDKRQIELPEYWIGRAPVTNAQFARFVRATNYKTTAEKEGFGGAWTGSRWELVNGADWWHPGGPKTSIDGKDDHPVVLVSWDDAQAFCDWAGLVLPSEEQWEKAARGTDGRLWPWGNEPPTDKHCNFNMNVKGTTPTGKYSPKGDSPYGCADMAGNVWETTGSWYKKNSMRALRGGSWRDDDQFQDTRATRRGHEFPDSGSDYIGFRVAELLSHPDS